MSSSDDLSALESDDKVDDIVDEIGEDTSIKGIGDEQARGMIPAHENIE